MTKYNLLLTFIFSSFPHFLGLTSLTDSAVGNSSIKCQDTPCMFNVVCCALEELARHILEFCFTVTMTSQGIFSVKGWILFLGQSKLTLVPFEIEEVVRLWYFGDSVKNIIPQEILGWKGQISPTKQDWENPWQWRTESTHAPAHTVTLLTKPPLISIGVGDRSLSFHTSHGESLHCLSCWLPPRRTCTDTHLTQRGCDTRNCVCVCWGGGPSSRFPPWLFWNHSCHSCFFPWPIKHTVLEKPKNFHVQRHLLLKHTLLEVISKPSQYPASIASQVQ